MKNLFEQSRSHWVRYDRYELKTAADRSGTSHRRKMRSPMCIIP